MQPSKEANAFIAIDDEPISWEIDATYYDPEDYKTVNPSIDEPLEVELKDLPPHLEYAFLEGDDKLPVIIAKDLKDEEKAALIKVLKSHKRAIAWKLSDIKGVNPEFCMINAVDPFAQEFDIEIPETKKGAENLRRSSIPDLEPSPK
ncbi:hypothetical protein Tco_0389139 [Tanacetum coccineum]